MTSNHWSPVRFWHVALKEYYVRFRMYSWIDVVFSIYIFFLEDILILDVFRELIMLRRDLIKSSLALAAIPIITNLLPITDNKFKFGIKSMDHYYPNGLNPGIIPVIGDCDSQIFDFCNVVKTSNKRSVAIIDCNNLFSGYKVNRDIERYTDENFFDIIGCVHKTSVDNNILVLLGINPNLVSSDFMCEIFKEGCDLRDYLHLKVRLLTGNRALMIDSKDSNMNKNNKYFLVDLSNKIFDKSIENCV